MTFDMNKMIEEHNNNFKGGLESLTNIKKIMKSSIDELLDGIHKTRNALTRLVKLTNAFIEQGKTGLVCIEYKSKQAGDLAAVFETYRSNLHTKLDAGVSTIEELEELVKGAHISFKFILHQNEELIKFNDLQIDKLEKVN